MQSVTSAQLGFGPDYGKRRRRPAARQSRDKDSPARSGANAASLRDTNSVKSRTRFVLRVSPCVRSQSVPYMCRSVTVREIPMYDQSKLSELIRFARIDAGSAVIDVYPGDGDWTRLFSDIVGP